MRPHDREFATIVEAQVSLDAWLEEYNAVRPHQSLGGRPPAERFALAARRLNVVGAADTSVDTSAKGRLTGKARRPAGVSRWVDQAGMISLAGFAYRVGATFSGEHVEVVVTGGLVEILHAGVLVATHVQRLRADQRDRLEQPTRRPRAQVQQRAREATTGLTVTRMADGDGTICFAGTPYRAGRAWARQRIDVAIVAGSVQLSVDDKVIRVHPIRHDRARELGAFANPRGRPRRKNSATGTVA